jgi:MFS family permease
MTLGLLVIGPLADRFGRRRTITPSAALLAVCTVLAAIASDPGELLAYRVAVGIGLGGTIPNAAAVIGDYCPNHRRGTLVAAIFAGFSVGAIVAARLTAVNVAYIAGGWCVPSPGR